MIARLKCKLGYHKYGDYKEEVYIEDDITCIYVKQVCECCGHVKYKTMEVNGWRD